jgi:hypothetical protein
MSRARNDQAVPATRRERRAWSCASEMPSKNLLNEKFLRQRPDARNSRLFIRIGGDIVARVHDPMSLESWSRGGSTKRLGASNRRAITRLRGGTRFSGKGDRPIETT